jgi:hypothetical protein
MNHKSTDRGWAAMRQMLDREMPVKHRRRFGWWWLTLLTLPIAVYGGWQWLRATHSTPEKQESRAAQPLASVGTEPVRSNSVQHVQNAPEAAKKSITGNDEKRAPLNKTGVTSFAKSGKRAEKTMDRSASMDGAQLISDLSPALSEASPSENSTPSQIQNLPLQLPLERCFISPKKVEYPGKSGIIPSYSFKPENLVTDKKSSTNAWSFGATSAASTEQFNNINGFSTGVTMDWKFARKWGLRTGLFYNIHSPQEKYRPVVSIQSDDYSTKVDGNVIFVDVNTGQEVFNTANNAVYSDSLSGNVFIPVNRIQRLELPVTAFWQPTRAFKVFGGLTLNRTLSTKADKLNFSNGYILQLADQTAADDASKLSSKELGNWSADAMLGIGFTLGKSFELGFAAKMPMNKISGYSTMDRNFPSAAVDNFAVSATRKISNPVFSLYGTLYF